MQLLRTFFALSLVVGLAGCDDVHGPTISGTITMSAELQNQLGESDTLYILAMPTTAGAPPVAVKRMVGVKFPLDYTFDAQDAIDQTRPFEGEVNVMARIKKSGIASISVPGDMEGAYPRNPVKVGAKDIDFAIDKVVK